MKTIVARLMSRLIWIAIGLGALFWILESVIHVYVFHVHDLITELLRPPPHEIWMRTLVAGLLILFGAYGQRIIDQWKRAENQVEHAHRELNQIFNAAVPLCLIDREYNLLRVNKTFCSFFGLETEEIVGKKCYEIWESTLCSTFECPMKQISKGIEKCECQVDKRLHNGRLLSCIVTAIPYLGPDDKLIGIVENFTDITERKKVEEALRASENQLRFLSSQLLAAQEQERRRLSTELHDELGQALIFLRLRLRSIQRALSADQMTLKEDCEEAIKYIRDVGENVRRLSRELSPSMLEDLGLAAAIHRLVDVCVRHSNMQGSVDITDLENLFSEETQIIVYRIVQECLTNVVKHAQASQVFVVVTKDGDHVSFCIEDDGKGFDLQGVLKKDIRKKGLGLAAAYERVRMVDGSLDIQSEVDVGTKITLAVPVDKGRA